MWSQPLHESKKRWKVVVAHRRAGKTTACLNHLIRDASQNPNTKYAYIAPTYKQAKNVAWDILKEYASKIDGIKFNESELRVDFKNLSRITLYGSDNPDALRGMGLWGVIFDEYSQQPSNIFSEIIRPALSDHKGYAIWIGTPKGKNDFFRLYERAKKEEGWLGILLKVDDTKLIAQKELDDSSQVMTEDEFNQEWYCSFEAAIKGAYYAKEISNARIENRIGIVPYDPVLKVHTVWDLVKGSNLAVGFYQRIGREIHMIDYWEGSNTDGIPTAIKALQLKSYVYGKHFAPHDAAAMELGTEKTRVETAGKLGLTLEIVPRMSINEGINAGKLMFSRLWIDEVKCALWIDAISQYHQEWDDKRGCFKDSPYHNWCSHPADVHRYASTIEEQMTNEDEEREIEIRLNMEENRKESLTNEFFE